MKTSVLDPGTNLYLRNVSSGDWRSDTRGAPPPSLFQKTKQKGRSCFYWVAVTSLSGAPGKATGWVRDFKRTLRFYVKGSLSLAQIFWLIHFVPKEIPNNEEGEINNAADFRIYVQCGMKRLFRRSSVMMSFLKGLVLRCWWWSTELCTQDLV